MEKTNNFTPTQDDAFDFLVAEFDQQKRKVEELAQFFNDPAYTHALELFQRYNDKDDRQKLGYDNPEGALKVLAADYWVKAMSRTDVWDWMPAERREQWNDQLRALDVPSFDEETVRATIGDLLMKRKHFFAEQVDGVFRALSRTHVTNQPEGFGKRFIIPNLFESWGSLSWQKMERLYDLRSAIATILGRERPYRDTTRDLIEWVRRVNGQWHTVDGGAFKIRIYNGVGTAHVEVNPQVAWRLNEVLSVLHPMAIPEKNRKPAKVKRKLKDFELMQDMLPDQVSRIVGGIEKAYTHERYGFNDVRRSRIPDTYLVCHSVDKHVNDRVREVLKHIGGVETSPAMWFFDYNPIDVCKRIQFDGSIPDFKSHQFYPTPDHIVDAAITELGLSEGQSVLEPSAGIGGIACKIPGNVTAVEISSLHCDILKARRAGEVIQADFMKWKAERKFDRIIMNPPYSQGRWKAHTERAASMLADGGVLVAILPASAANGWGIDGFKVVPIEVFKDDFDKASVDVVVVKITR